MQIDKILYPEIKPYNEFKLKATIAMNEPLRYKGYTFYQSQFFPKDDNKAEKSELDIVDNLSKLLEIDQGKFNKIKERQLPIKMHVEKDDPCSIVGVTSEMSSEEIRIHIKKNT